jgi:hypothetical protein
LRLTTWRSCLTDRSAIEFIIEIVKQFAVGKVNRLLIKFARHNPKSSLNHSFVAFVTSWTRNAGLG